VDSWSHEFDVIVGGISSYPAPTPTYGGGVGPTVIVSTVFVTQWGGCTQTQYITQWGGCTQTEYVTGNVPESTAPACVIANGRRYCQG
jgi:hypothetical protein